MEICRGNMVRAKLNPRDHLLFTDALRNPSSYSPDTGDSTDISSLFHSVLLRLYYKNKTKQKKSKHLFIGILYE